MEKEKHSSLIKIFPKKEQEEILKRIKNEKLDRSIF